jgi:polyisoprenoid-binding protein YceI
MAFVATRYRFDPGLSHFTVQAFATGILSFLGHSPTFAVRAFAGVVAFENDQVEGMRLEVTVRADSLQVVDNARDKDRREIEDTMRREVLETAAYAEVRYEGAAAVVETVAPGRHRVRVAGRLTLHGVTRDHPLDVGLLVFGDGIRLRGETPLRLSEYRIRPVTALGGTIRLKDELMLSFDVAAVPEGS